MMDTVYEIYDGGLEKSMSDIFIAGGWFMWPLLACSIAIISISIERFWMLQERLVSPSGLDKQVQI